MPTPGTNESHDEFIERCIPVVLTDGTAESQEQAVAVCESMWSNKMSKAIEHKLHSFEASEIKFATDGSGVIEGYASTFGGVDAYGDTIQKGAFANTLKKRERPVQLRWQHFGPVIGKWVELSEDDKGLKVKGELTEGHSLAEDVHALLKHGAIEGLSIGFFPVKFETDEETQTRTLTEIELVEVSIVESPADLGAKVSDVKSAIEQATTLKEVESALRDGGMTWAASTALVSKMKALILGDRESKTSAIEAIRQFRKSITEETNHGT